MELRNYENDENALLQILDLKIVEFIQTDNLDFYNLLMIIIIQSRFNLMELRSDENDGFLLF